MTKSSEKRFKLSPWFWLGRFFRGVDSYCLPFCLSGSLNFDWLTWNTESWLVSWLIALKNVSNCLPNSDWQKKFQTLSTLGTSCDKFWGHQTSFFQLVEVIVLFNSNNNKRNTNSITMCRSSSTPVDYSLHLVTLVNYATSVVFHSHILVCPSQVYLRSWTYSFPIQIWNFLHDCLLCKLVLLRHIIIGHANITFCERLNSNPFIRTFVHFTIFVLNWHDFISYSIVLPMSISDRVFHSLNIFLCVLFTLLLKSNIKVLA